jgi:hypothetical protein
VAGASFFAHELITTPPFEERLVGIRSFCFEEKGRAASGLLSLANPASHKACRSALKLVIAKETF